MEQYKVMEAFYSIQGEGYHTGKPAFFIRLAGCNVGCSWCDVKESWEADHGKLYTVVKLVDLVTKSKANLVVVTGGEPTLYNLEPLTAALQQQNIKTHLETAGTNPLTGTWDWICLSPKKFKQPLQANLALAHELKIVVVNASDFAWGEQQAAAVSAECCLYLQPEWSKANKMMEAIYTYVKDFPKWRISLQTHKFMNVP